MCCRIGLQDPGGSSATAEEAARRLNLLHTHGGRPVVATRLARQLQFSLWYGGHPWSGHEFCIVAAFSTFVEVIRAPGISLRSKASSPWDGGRPVARSTTTPQRSPFLHTRGGRPCSQFFVASLKTSPVSSGGGPYGADPDTSCRIAVSMIWRSSGRNDLQSHRNHLLQDAGGSPASSLRLGIGNVILRTAEVARRKSWRSSGSGNIPSSVAGGRPD